MPRTISRWTSSLIAAFGMAVAMGAAPTAEAQVTFKVADVNSYARFPQATMPTRKAMQMAFDEVNARGGVAGMKFEMVSRDDGASPATLATVLQELVTKEKVDIIVGAGLSSTALAAAAFAKQNKIIYIASHATTDALSLDGGNRYTMRVRTGTRSLISSLMDEAKKKQAKRWALVLPNYEFGLKIAEEFKRILARDFPGATIVAEQYPALGSMDAGATVQALLAAKPDAILNAMFDVDLPKLVREGELRGLFKGRQVYSVLTGNPEFLSELKDEAPVDWIVTGWPYYAIKRPENVEFVKNFKARYNEDPGESAINGYLAAHLIIAMATKAGSKDTEAMLKTIEGLQYPSPVGVITMRSLDNQGDAPSYVGRVVLVGGMGQMTDIREVSVKPFLLSEQEVRAARPTN